MSCNNCNNCAQCNSTPTIPVVPAPTCINTTACEEYILSDCVSSTIEGACISQLYQYNPNGSLDLDPSGNPTPFIPAVPLGISISNNETLTSILTELVSSKNCSFNPNYIAGMLQVIQANPTHPVSQIFTNLVCAAVTQCNQDCQIQIVETVTFPSNLTTDEGFVVSFTGEVGYIYTIEVTDTSALIPTPAYSYTYPTAFAPNPGPTGTINFNTNLLPTPGGVLPSGHTFEVVIISESNNQSCSSNSFTTFTDQSPLCSCVQTVSAQFEAGLIGEIGVYIWISAPVAGYTPQFYQITAVDSTTGDVVLDPAFFDPTLYPLPVGSPSFPNGAMYLNFGNDLGGDYVISISAICELTPSSTCASITYNFDHTVTAALDCGPPSITSVIVTP